MPPIRQTSRQMSEGLGGPECCQGKVLVITNDFPPRRGGIETFVQHLCAAVPSDRLVVYTSATAGAAQHDVTLDYPVIRDRSAVLLPTPRVARRVQRVASAHGCDRVVFGAAAPLGLLASGLRGAGVCRIVALTHGHEVWWAKTPLARHALSRISESVDALTYVSDYCRTEISRALPPAGAARLTRLSPGVDTQRFRPGLDREVWRREWQISLEQPVVLAAGRLVERKGHDTLIRGWPEVLRERPDAVLVILGDGPHRRTLTKRIARQGLTGSIRLVGDAQWSQMPEIYAAADVFALPCRTRRWGLEPEAFGIVFIEAAASGLPVVVGDSGGAPETVLHGESGYVIDPGDLDGLTRRIVELINDPELAKAMGERGRAYVSRRFSDQRCADEFRRLLNHSTPPDADLPGGRNRVVSRDSTNRGGPDSMAEQTTSSIVIAAEPANVMNAIADFESYPRWVRGVKSAVVVSTDARGRAREVNFVLDAPPIRDEYTLAYEWQGDARVTWSLVRAKMLTAMEGAYVLRPQDGSTEVSYQLTLDLAIPMIGMLKRKGERVVIETALKGLKHRVESQS